MRHFPKVVFNAACILMALLSSCKTPKEVLRTEVRQSDTLITKTEVVKAPLVNDVLTIKELCDSITNRPVQFKKVYVVDGDSIEVLTSENNDLKITVNRRERTLDSLYSEIRRLEKKSSKYEKEVVVKKDWRLVLILLGILLVFILFPAVPKFVNTVFRRLSLFF